MANFFEAETRTLEFKREYTKNILKTVSAFANYHDGEIIFGIGDDASIIGIDDYIYTKLRIENAINDNISPKPYYEIHDRKIGEKNIIILRVHRGENTPYLYNKKAYKRMDTSTIEVDLHGYENLILHGRNLGYDELYYDSDNLEFNYLNKVLREKLDLSVLSNDILKTLGLIKNEKYVNAAALMADNNPFSNAGMSLIRFDGRSVSNIKDRLFLKNMSILEVYDKSIDFYHKHINISEIIKDAYRKTMEQVPIVAYREAVANAIVHRDYTIEADTRVEIYDDRIEIISPGGLPIGITEEEYIEGRISVSRNKIIADIFFRLGIIERLATGIRRIKENYRKFNVKPDFLITAKSIKVILPFIDNKDFSSERVNEDTNEYNIELTEAERLIINYIKQNKQIDRKNAEKLLGLKKTYTVKILNNMISKGFIRRAGKGRGTVYILDKI